MLVLLSFEELTARTYTFPSISQIQLDRKSESHIFDAMLYNTQLVVCQIFKVIDPFII